MAFRFKELIRYIIPGFYLLLQIVIFLFIEYRDVVWDTMLSKNISGIVTIGVFVTPVVAYIAGYWIEIIASNIEYYKYKLDWKYVHIIRRPSFRILKDQRVRYRITDREKLLKYLGIKDSDIKDNETAKILFDKANQRIDKNERLEECLFQSMVARNIFGAQFILWCCSVCLLIDCIIGCPVFIGYTVFSWLIYYRWVQRSMTYTKYVLVEYLKQCTKTQGSIPKS